MTATKSPDLYLAGLAAVVDERLHAFRGGRARERFAEQLVLDPQPGSWVTDRGVDRPLGRGDDVAWKRCDPRRQRGDERAAARPEAGRD